MDELYYEIMVGPEAFEVVPQMKIVLDRLAVRILIISSLSVVFFLLSSISPPSAHSKRLRSDPPVAGIIGDSGANRYTHTHRWQVLLVTCVCVCVFRGLRDLRTSSVHLNSTACCTFIFLSLILFTTCKYDVLTDGLVFLFLFI